MRLTGSLQSLQLSPPDDDGHFVAPLADLLVVDSIDGAVFPVGQRARLRSGVGVAGRGVERELRPVIKYGNRRAKAVGRYSRLRWCAGALVRWCAGARLL